MNHIKSKSNNMNLAFSLKSAILDNIFLVLSVLGLGLTLMVLFVGLTHNPFYSVTSSLLFEPKIPELVYNSNDRYLHSFEDWMRTQSHEIESNQVLLAAIHAYEDSGYVWIQEGESKKTAVDRLRARLNISQINNTQIMTIALGSGSTEGLAEIVNAVANSYILHKDQQRKTQDQKKLDYLRDEKDKYNVRLDAAYQDLMDISKTYGTAVADEKNLYIYLDMFVDLRSRYNKILTDRIESENKLSALNTQKGQLLTMDVYDLQNTQELLKMEQSINAKMVGLKPGSDLFSQYSQMLAEIDTNSIRSARKYLVADVDHNISEQTMLRDAAKLTEKDLQKELRKAQLELMDINTAVLKTSTQRQAIERIINIWDRINDRIEQIEIELFNPGRVHVLSAAQSPEFPDPNKLMKKLFIGIITIFGLSIGVASARELSDKRVKRVSDIERVLGFPATGFLLDASTENIPEENLDSIYRRHPLSYMTELYNQLAVKIEKEHGSFGAQTFSLFSLKGKSGVSSTAKNILAMLDADKHEKILVDLNAQPPLLGAQGNSVNVNGLITWLAKHKTLENGIERDVDAYYDVLPLGSLREMDIARIRPSVVQELFSRLKKDYKYIFIDGPPLLTSSESQTIAQETDASILVVDSQKNIWPELTRAVSILDKLKVSVISVILNKVQLKRAGYMSKTLNDHYANQKTENNSNQLEMNKAA
ncbi:MAG: hypothetical protein HON27_03555 [Candidatus Marinimicrobia bacterium]|jgi:polysaccharide biosynthesis transport protein|nr:hypothetical protein [Candidatus Neomarinimicrobiota bacterium]MBT4036373.1 hypothetical protein [Candidatus Neomarinimicrobiota bacterium]MBT4361262.1 hypothetical protein [Candidatus Neomarinimicrobiota bacterium]MBT4945227.1 hypothetical protein [Candidatus Neomarinimicrobiota bacterium]MBT5268524.1 hypothetical protein [Candidatus Neomarinimicrobiota bacterium]